MWLLAASIPCMLSDWRPQFLAGCWKEATPRSLPCSGLQRQLTTWRLASSKPARKRESLGHMGCDQKTHLFYFNLLHLFGMILHTVICVRILKLVIMFTLTIININPFWTFFISFIIIRFRGLWSVLTLWWIQTNVLFFCVCGFFVLIF